MVRDRSSVTAFAQRARSATSRWANRRVAGQVLLRAALLLGVVLAVLVPKPPVAAAEEFFPGVDVTCKEAWSWAGAGYSDASSSWADKYYYFDAGHNCTRYAAY